MKSKKLHTTLLFIMLWSLFSFAQQYTHYTTKDGLPSNHVYRITQDTQGFIWFITDKGMVKFNGTEFKKFTTKEGLPTNDIWDIRCTPDTKIWYFSKSAKLGYILKDSIYAFESSLKNEILYPSVISQNKNKILFSNSSKTYFLKDNKWNSFQINSLQNTKEPIIHSNIKELVVDDDSLFIKDKHLKVVKSFVKPEILNTSRHREQINDSLFCWVNNQGYELLNLNSLRFISRKFSNQLDIAQTKLVRINTANNQIQFSGQDFAGILDEKYNLKEIIYIDAALKSHFSFIDRNQNIWIATFNNGVYFLPYAKRKTINLLEQEKVGKLQFVNNDIVVNVYAKGFYKYDLKSKKIIPFIKENDFIFSAVHIDSLKTDFFITNKKIIQIKNNSLKRTINNKDEFARSLVLFNGYLYGNNSFCINKIDPKNLRILKQYLQNGIRNIAVYKNQLIIATANGLKILKNDQLTNVFENETILNKPIISLTKTDNNKLIVCTDGFGAYSTDLNKTTLLEQSDFLSVQNAFVRHDEIWLATNEGILQYSKEQDTFKLKRKYTINDGLSSNLINSVIITNNEIIASSNGGISILTLDQKKITSFISLYFKDIKFNDQPLSNNKQVIYTADNYLSVGVASIDFSQVNDLNYSYQLLPIQKKWISTSSKQISYTDLPPNKYVLNIKTKGEKNSVYFEILPLWYQTLLAKFLFILLFLTTITSIILLVRKRELRKQAKKLNTKRKLAEFELYALRSQMNPHFVFNSLNAIQYYLNANKIELSEKYLVKFSKLIRMFFDFSEHKDISIKEEIQLLDAYLEIEKLRFGKEFNYLINADNNLNLEQDIPVMLLQPIVENAVNHGLFHNFGKGFIRIFFQEISKRCYEVIIEDNGVGREKAKAIKEHSLNKHQSKSSQILQERIALLNQSNVWKIVYKITDLDKKNKNGTRVYLKFERL